MAAPVEAVSWAAFVERYQASELALQAYVKGLPLWVNVWRGWMFFIFTAFVVFLLWKREARRLAVVMMVSIVAYNLVAGVSGAGRFPRIAFVVLWSPLAVYFARRWPRLQASSRFDRLYSWWFGAALATLAVSLAFDTYKRWLFADSTRAVSIAALPNKALQRTPPSAHRYRWYTFSVNFWINPCRNCAAGSTAAF